MVLCIPVLSIHTCLFLWRWGESCSVHIRPAGGELLKTHWDSDTQTHRMMLLLKRNEKCFSKDKTHIRRRLISSDGGCIQIHSVQILHSNKSSTFSMSHKSKYRSVIMEMYSWHWRTCFSVLYHYIHYITGLLLQMHVSSILMLLDEMELILTTLHTV